MRLSGGFAQRLGKAFDLAFGKHCNAVFGKGRNFSLVNKSRQIWRSETGDG
jgi:hypothetical protein